LISGEGHGEQRVGTGPGDEETGDAAERGENDAFGEELADDAGARGSEGGAEGHLRFAAHAADEQEIGDVAAGDEENDAGDPHEQVEVGLVLILKVLDTAPCGGEDDVGFGEGQLALGVGVHGIRGDDLAEEAADFGLQRGEGDTRFEAADDVEPLHRGAVDVSDVHEGGHGLHGEVVVGWRAGEAVAIETLRRNSGDDDGLGVDPECGTDDGRIAGVVVLPVFVADDGDRGGAGDVVGIGDKAAGSRSEAEGAEVVAGDELTHDGACGFLGAIAADGDGAVGESGLNGGERLELGDFLLELLPGVGGEERVGVAVGVATGVDAAVVVVAKADEGRGVGNGKVAHEDGVDEGEDGSVGANAESQGEDGGGGEAGGFLQLPQRVADVLDQGGHH
jgi:hypothetical protein